MIDLTSDVNLVTGSSEEIIAAGSAFQSLMVSVLINVSCSIWHLKCHWMLIPTASIWGLKVVIRYTLSLIQEGQLSVSGQRLCTILVNRLED